MKLVNIRAALALVLGLAMPVMAAETPDPRLAKLTYEGSGTAEKAPEYGEVMFSFNVACRQNATDVRTAIEAVSGQVWKTISGKVTGATETDKAHWGDIGNINESERAPIQIIYPSPDGKIKGSAHRLDVCSGGKKLPVTAKLPTVFSGQQSFGVRSSDLNWLEGLVRSVSAIPQDKARNTVKVQAGSISYLITEGAKRNMIGETLTKARQEALGANSKFASDKKTLKFKNAHYLGHRAGNPPQYFPAVGTSIGRGQAPKVQLDMPMTYTIYAEANDLIDTTDSKSVGLKSEYEVTGSAVVDADFATISASVQVNCQATKQAATAALEPHASDILKSLRDFQGNKAASETDRVENNEAGEPSQHFPYQPIEWKNVEGQQLASKYLNLCTNEIVDAPASNQPSDLTGYWQASRSFGLRSTDFAKIVPLAEDMQKKYNTETVRTDETRVAISDAQADVTDATKQKLATAARENAMKSVLDPKGLLAQDIKANGLVKAHLLNVRVGSPRASRNDMQLESATMKSRAMMAPASAAGAPSELPVEIVLKPNGERPQYRVVRHYAFDVQVISENYVPLLKGPKAPTPKSTPLP